MRSRISGFVEYVKLVYESEKKIEFDFFIPVLKQPLVLWAIIEATRVKKHVPPCVILLLFVFLCYITFSCEVALEQREENSRTCSLQGLLST